MAIRDDSAESMAISNAIHMCLLLMLICQCSPVAGSRGREFYLVFMEVKWSVSDSGLSLYVTITNPNAAAVQVHVRYLGFLFPPSDSNLTVASSDVLGINQSVILFGAEKHTKCLHVTSTDDIYLHSSVLYTSSGRWSITGFMCLPTSALTSEYVVATHCVTERCVMVVTSAEDGNHVQISLRVGAGENQALYRGKYYQDNELIVESLNVGESMQVTCYKCDLTGSWVNATKKVVVFGGGRWTKVPDRDSRDAVAEQMMPVEALGRRYVLGVKQPPLRADVKVVLLHAGDYLTKDGITYTAGRDRDVKVFHEEDFNRVVEITGSAPMLVAEVVYGSRNDEPDISMLLPPPSSLWSTGYVVYLLFNAFNTICIVQSNSSPHVKVVVVDSGYITRESSSSGDYRLTTVIIYNGRGRVELRCTDPGCRPFWAFVIQSASHRAASYALPPLWTLSSTQTTGAGVPQATSPTTVETAVMTTPAMTSALTTAPQTIAKTTTPLTTAKTTTPLTTPLTTAKTTLPLTSAKTTTPLTIAKTIALKTTEKDLASVSQSTTIAAESSTGGSVSQRTELSTTPEQSTTADDIKTTDDVTTTSGVTPITDVTTQSDVTPQSSVFTRSPCGCNCVKNVAASSVSPEERERMMEEAKAAIKSALQTDRKNVSAYVRSKRSAPDQRVSSTVVGSSIGITCFVIVFGFLVGSDMVNLIRFVKDRRER